MKYREGKLNTVANGLSRCHAEREDESCDNAEGEQPSAEEEGEDVGRRLPTWKKQ